MTQHIINLHTWVSLPNEVRYKLSALFNIPRTGNVVVNDGRIETDGTTVEDIRHLTLEKMQEYLSSPETDFHKLFDLTVARVIQGDVPVEPNVAPKKRGRPSTKNA